MFKPVESRVKFPELETAILEEWKKKKIFTRSVEARKGNERFSFYEGPPTANGKPGIHHVLARAFKDVITRYKTMKGYYTPRIGGWDTHGLPVELEVENKLGFSGKQDIEAYGIAEFNTKCRESVFTYLKDWEALTERIAYWVDLENAYVTMKNNYIESVWWAIKTMWDKGLIYQGYRVTPHCPRCGTSLSSHEVAQGYKENTSDPSVYIKFKIVLKSLEGSPVRDRLYARFSKGDKPAYLLAWTTTPWTLPANTAVAVSESSEYAVVETAEEYLILASARLGVLGETPYEIVDTILGSDLVDTEETAAVEYEPLFNPHKFGVERKKFEKCMDEKGNSYVELVTQEPDENLVYLVLATDFVSMDDGTGIVHMAPAYGEVDYQAGEEQGANFVHHVALDGTITGTYPFAGKFVKDADPLVLEELKKNNNLFLSESILHTYPFCWRCNAPLLYYAKQTWYIRTTAVKDRLIEGNDQINWYPEHIKYGRFGDWLQNNIDWAFSRERYWGTPLPIWKCEKCGSFECIGGVKDLSEKDGFSGMPEPLDLHRPYVDDATFTCKECGGTMKRVPEVIDCWFDSGAMPIGQLHYPFENNTMLADRRFPADYICEAVDQTRGWFYSLHAIATLLFDQPCYRNVICLGHILDAKGEKMSKTKGNVVEPWDIINKFGADPLRWYCFTSSPPGNVRRFDAKFIQETSRTVFSTLWNVYSFFVLYANIDKYNPAEAPQTVALAELDRWILSELNQLILDVDKALDSYDPTTAGRRIESFIDVLSNWYVRRSRRRFWKSENDTDKIGAYNTLYHCLVTVSRLMAPLAPFVADALYRNLVADVIPEAPESVHLADFPVANVADINRDLSDFTQMVIKVCSLGRAARSQAGIKVRQPLEKILVKLESRRDSEGLQYLLPQVLEELNVKDVEVIEDVEPFRTDEYVINEESGYTVVIPTKISDELLAEGMARELVHRVQNMRRNAGYDIADHIRIYYQGNEYIQQVMKAHASYIKQETLSHAIVEGIPDTNDGINTEVYKVSGYEVQLGVKKES